MKKKGVVSTLKGQEDGIPAVPLTVEGWNVLHQMFRFRWSSWQALPSADRQAALEETRALLEEMEQRAKRFLFSAGAQGRSHGSSLSAHA